MPYTSVVCYETQTPPVRMRRIFTRCMCDVSVSNPGYVSLLNIYAIAMNGGKSEVVCYGSNQVYSTS